MPRRFQFSLKTLLWITLCIGASIVLAQQAWIHRRTELAILLAEGSGGCLGAAIGSGVGQRLLAAGLGVLAVILLVVLICVVLILLI